MAEYDDNPAGRLHRLLTHLTDNPDRQILESWSHALGVRPTEVPRGLIGVADLVEDTRQTAERTGQDLFVDIPAHLDSLGQIIFPTTQAMTASVRSITPSGFDYAMRDLLALSRYLHQHSPGAKIPDIGEITELVTAARELIASVATSDVLPPELKGLLIQQLKQVLESLEQVRVGGPEHVRLAVLALAGSVKAYEPVVAKYQPASKVSATFDPIKKWAAAVTVAVAFVGPLAGYAIDWDHILHTQPQIEAPAHVDVEIDVTDVTVDPKPSANDQAEPEQAAAATR